MGLYCPLSNLWYAALDTTDFQYAYKLLKTYLKAYLLLFFKKSAGLE